MNHPSELLEQMFHAGLRAARPEFCMQGFLPERPKGRTLVIGAGKASAAMAKVFEELWGEPVTGLVVTRYGYAQECRHIEIVEAGHPLPDAAGARAAQRMLALVQGLGADDLVVCLFSGGGSALLPLPGHGLDLAQKQAINRALLNSGASITEINCLRRHLSAIKGGRLAAACAPARVVNLLISDVPGDRPCDIASGPSVPDATTCADALDIVRRYRIDLPDDARRWLHSSEAETIKPDDKRLARVSTRIIASAQIALEAAAAQARSAGITPVILGDRIEGEAREVAKVLAGIALQVRAHGQPTAAPCVLLSGGETTVSVRGQGSGGRNVEFLLAAALALEGAPGIYALAADTDGVDGQEEVAGALIGPDTLARARAQGMRARDYLDNNDGHGFFRRLNDALITGPTFTNVNDLRAFLVLGNSCRDASPGNHSEPLHDGRA